MTTLLTPILTLLALWLTLLLKPLCERWIFPVAAVLILLGFAISEGVVYAGFDTGFRYTHFTVLIQYWLLPLLIFSTAFSLPKEYVWRTALKDVYYQLPLFLLMFFATAGLLYLFFGHSSGFPWQAAFLCSAMLAAVDCHIMKPFISRLPGAEKAFRFLETETVFSEILAVVLFGFILSINLHMQLDTTSEIIWLGKFIWLIIGSFFIGFFVSKIFGAFLRFKPDPIIICIASILAAYTTNVLAVEFLASGPLAVFALAYNIRDRIIDLTQGLIKQIWGFIILLVSLIIFYLVGVSITVPMLEERYVAMLFAIAAVFLPRLFFSFPMLTIAGHFRWISKLNMQQKSVYTFSTQHGVIAIALAFSLPTELPYWWTLQAMAFGVVLFDIFVQAPIVNATLLHKRTTDDAGS